MTDLEKRYADSTKLPLICSQHMMPGSGNPVLLAEYDTAYIYLWCRIGRHVHPVRLRDLLTAQGEASTSLLHVL